MVFGLELGNRQLFFLKQCRFFGQFNAKLCVYGIFNTPRKFTNILCRRTFNINQIIWVLHTRLGAAYARTFEPHFFEKPASRVATLA